MRQSGNGFTLIELLVVMGIILILISVAMPAVNVARNKAKDTQVKSGCNNIQAAIEQFGVDNAGCYPGAHWEESPNLGFLVGPGVIGGLPSYDGTEPRKDFTVPKTDIPGDATSWRDPYLDDGTPNPQVLDSLVVGGYLTDYPANPFISAGGAAKSQMSNIFLFNPIQGASGTTPMPANSASLDWDRYSPASAPLPTAASMRQQYLDFGRGMFTYIPLNPVNNAGTDFVSNWNNLAPDERAQYYRRCRGYILVGWGTSRLSDDLAKGVSHQYWNGTLAGLDFDHSLTLDQLETDMSNAVSLGSPASSWVGCELRDSAGSVGSFGAALPGGVRDFNPALFGAVFLKITGS
jgi:prepilin-type N-terminal cleavage/methylation domain-containing protein